MSRPKSKMPTYRYHLSGQAVVTLDGRDFYLGPHQSAISLARYAALIRIYQKNNLTLPEHIRVDDVELGIQAVDTALAAEPTHQNRQPAKVRDAIAAYRVEIEKKYASSPQEHHRHSRICTMLDDGYGNFSAQDFGPVKLREFRDVLVESGNSRKYVNRLTRIVVGLFRHAVSEELIDVDIVKRLETLPPLKRNQTSAPETQRRRPVRLEVVRATAAHLSPVLKAMLRVQLSTGMRPKELCSIRPTDIDKSGEHWMYRPGDHKTAHHDIEKAVPIVDDARDALTDYMNRQPAAYCFSPKESMEWVRAQRRAARTTPDSCGNRPGTNRVASPKKQPGEKYDASSYRRAIQTAAEKAGVEKWSPYQIRHLTAGEVREVLGIEAVSALLGHQSTRMSEHYAKQKERAAIEAAKAAPRLTDKID